MEIIQANTRRARKDKNFKYHERHIREDTKFYPVYSGCVRERAKGNIWKSIAENYQNWQ